MKKLNSKKSRLNSRNMDLAEKFIASNIPKSPYSRIHEYDYVMLQKGIKCSICGSTLENYKCSKLICTFCHSVENIDSAVLRNLGEYTLLFPDRKITANAIFEWCGSVVPKKMIRKVLKKHLKITGYGQWSHYV